jgi:hypothetical protein
MVQGQNAPSTGTTFVKTMLSFGAIPSRCRWLVPLLTACATRHSRQLPDEYFAFRQHQRPKANWKLFLSLRSSFDDSWPKETQHSFHSRKYAVYGMGFRYYRHRCARYNGGMGPNMRSRSFLCPTTRAIFRAACHSMFACWGAWICRNSRAIRSSSAGLCRVFPGFKHSFCTRPPSFRCEYAI